MFETLIRRRKIFLDTGRFSQLLVGINAMFTKDFDENSVGQMKVCKKPTALIVEQMQTNMKYLISILWRRVRRFPAEVSPEKSYRGGQTVACEYSRLSSLPAARGARAKERLRFTPINSILMT